ncbi:MAG: hypothetical protein AB7E26_15585 [Chryseobacterium sp.]
MIGKFGRTYRLDIFTPSGDQISIEPPFSIKFSITRNTLASLNSARITIYNLGPNTRNRIYRDRFATIEVWPVTLFSGYGNRLHSVFVGEIFEAYSYKQGKDWITELSCLDGINAIQNGVISTTITKGVDFKKIIKRIIDTMPGITAGILGSPADGVAERGISLIGSSADSINEIVKGRYFIDKQKLHILSTNEVLPGDIIFLDPSSLLSTPRRRESFVDVSTLFEPQIEVASQYLIESIEPVYNGIYKVVGFNHDVTISNAESGQARTDIQLNFANRIVVVNGE